MRTLDVWWADKRAGALTQDRSGDLSFRYDPAWLESTEARALSVSLPKRSEPFSRRECRPFFAGLLPEEAQRAWVAGALGVSERNDFALLDGLGGDVAGAIALLPQGATPPRSSYEPQTKALADDELVDVLARLPARPMLAGEHGLRLSLAGAQSKLPVVLVDGEIGLPKPGQPTTHILKPPIAHLPATTENEAAVMRLAKVIGLDVAEAVPRVVNGRPYLLVERYDRKQGADGTTRRIHQEDFCQALGIPPEQKYAAEGGPVFKDCFELVRRVSARPAQDVIRLLDAAIFNVVVGNADAHAKNFSILYDDSGPRLAPLYDLLSTIRYPGLSGKSAMRLGRAARLEEIGDDSWARFRADSGLAMPFIRRRAGELAETLRMRVRGLCDDLAGVGLDETSLKSLAEDIGGRAERLVLKLPSRRG